MKTLMRLGCAALLTLPGLIALGATPAFAHQEVTLGEVDFEIGFQSEPVYVGFQNGVFLAVHDEGGKPVEDVADTLKVQIVYGTQTMDVALEPNFEEDTGGAPGQYVAHFIPTRPGKYTFHLSGSIGGEQIDRSFTSSSTTFDEAVDPTTVEFPAKDPTTSQLAERFDREIPRVTQTAAAQASAAGHRADTARTLGLIAIALGGVGLVAGTAGLVIGVRRGRS
jgi:hypothetical protein